MKQKIEVRRRRYASDAPHTGARLETDIPRCPNLERKMPPTRGHDLKLKLGLITWNGETLQDAPHTGARLETARSAVCGDYAGCPPHGGTT